MDRLTAQGQTFGVMAAAMYTDRCKIVRRVSRKVGLDTTYSLVTVAVNLPIKIRPATAYEREVAGATQATTAFTISVPAWQGQTITELDSMCSVEIAAREGGVEAQTLQVVAPLPNTSSKLEAVALKQS